MQAVDPSEAEYAALAYLEHRIGRLHIRQRLGLERDYEARVFRRGTHFFHLENWTSSHALIRLALRLAGVYGRGRRNACRIQLREHPVRLARLPATFDDYRLLHLSDLHLDVGEPFVTALIERVRDIEADVCVLTGDYRFHTFGSYGNAAAALSRLRAALPETVYAVLGNHDTIRMVPAMEEMGIRVLINESVRLERDGDAIWLAGIDDAHYFRMQNFHAAAHDVPAEAVSILLSHTPETYRHAAHADFKLMLCGHTHGGQICLPGGIPIITDADCPRAMARGSWRYGEMVGYTSLGAGSSIVDVRLNCLPEVTLHRLFRAQ